MRERRVTPRLGLASLAAIPLVALLGACDRGAAITAADLRADVTYLASDALAGRETGQPGEAQAERFIASQFARDRLQPLPGRKDFFLDFTLYRHTYDPAETRLAFSRGGDEIPAVLGASFRPFWFSRMGSVRAPVVFAGYGITAPEHGWDDYAGLDVSGKIVLVLRHEPVTDGGASRWADKDFTRHAFFVTKARNALAHGAAGMVLFTDPAFHPSGSDDLRVDGALSLDPAWKPSGGAETVALLSAQISRELAAKLLQPSGYTPESVQAAVDGGAKPRDVDLRGLSASLGVGAAAAAAQEVPARDVAGYLRGSDPKLADEWIVVGAHHDHLGAIPNAPGDGIYNGADDNASGTSGVLELAQYFAAVHPRPARSMVFMTFTGEEEGLFGSEALFARGLVPRDRLRFMINLDMIGRNPDQPVRVFGKGVDERVRTGLETTAEALDLKWTWSGAGPSPANSDYGPFTEAGVPFLSFFTGEHEDYHEVTDEAGKLAYRRMEQLVRWVGETMLALAQR